jgi:hypothetical protein
VPDDYFRTGVWASSGRLRLRHATCVGCGHRFGTYEAWRLHRIAGCQGALMGGDATNYREVQDAILGHLAALSADDLDHLTDLADQVDPAEDQEGT